MFQTKEISLEDIGSQVTNFTLDDNDARQVQTREHLIRRAYEMQRPEITIRNPWGKGIDTTEGTIDITVPQFKRNFTGVTRNL